MTPASLVDDDGELEETRSKKAVIHYIPLCLIFIFLLAPQPSILIVAVRFHLQVLRAPLLFATHLLVMYTFTFLAVSSLIVCLARDPGPVHQPHPQEANHDLDPPRLTQALLTTHGYSSEPVHWCRKCKIIKPPRTHHCSACGRCVLKMDHHCPWIASKCIGHRTYRAFLHFLGCITILASYITVMSISACLYAFQSPLMVDGDTLFHELLLVLAGMAFSLTIGPFFVYHIYLVATNQTTIENLTPFLLLQHLPPFASSEIGTRAISTPPLEHELNREQRNLVRDAHGCIRIYDVGWRKNFALVFGSDARLGVLNRVIGGGVQGDGRAFPHNPRSEELLARLASDLLDAGKDG